MAHRCGVTFYVDRVLERIDPSSPGAEAKNGGRVEMRRQGQPMSVVVSLRVYKNRLQSTASSASSSIRSIVPFITAVSCSADTPE